MIFGPEYKLRKRGERVKRVLVLPTPGQHWAVRAAASGRDLTSSAFGKWLDLLPFLDVTTFSFQLETMYHLPFSLCLPPFLISHTCHQKVPILPYIT